MPLFLSEIGYRELSDLGERLEWMAEAATTREAYAQGICHLLHTGLIERDGGASTVLVRCFEVVRGGDLPPDLQAFAGRLAPGMALENVPCLTLLGTAGLEPAWNHRRLSEGHQAIPLQNAAALERIPMVRQLLAQLRLEVLRGDPTVESLQVSDPRRGDRIFFVADAPGSPDIPAQAEFIRPYGVASILGFGDMLPDRGAFTVLLFCRVDLDPQMIQSFRILTLHVRHAFERMKTCPRFEG